MSSVAELIEKKKLRGTLSTAEMTLFVDSVARGTVPDAQIGAMLMAMLLNGLDDDETFAMTYAMANGKDSNGNINHLTWPEKWKGTIGDKHSTGGVGDKVSLVLAPALAACGVRVPMISGRGLDFTGGTLDKLESIPGFRVQLSHEEMQQCLLTAGCFIAGQTNDIAPADKELYRVRDITKTVDYNPFIIASILSKKKYESVDALVLDVKYGRASFMKTKEQAQKLADGLVSVSKRLGMQAKAVLSPMDVPLGRAVGLAVEVEEAIEVLRGKGPTDLITLVQKLGGVLLHSLGIVESQSIGEECIGRSLENGTALERCHMMIECQGVDREAAEELCHGDVWKVLPRAKKITNVLAPCDGQISDGVDALSIGKLICKLGGGRVAMGSSKEQAGAGGEKATNLGGGNGEKATNLNDHGEMVLNRNLNETVDNLRGCKIQSASKSVDNLAVASAKLMSKTAKQNVNSPKSNSLDLSVGVNLFVVEGSEVRKGDLIAKVHHSGDKMSEEMIINEVLSALNMDLDKPQMVK